MNLNIATDSYCPGLSAQLWVGHAGERRRNPAGHLYGTGESTDDPYCSNQPVVGCTRTPIGQGQAQLRNDLIMKQRLCALDGLGEAGRRH
jgi:hypothetical protein